MRHLTLSIVTLISLVFSLLTAGCDTSEDDPSCDPANDAACLCTDDITGDECLKGGANCTCRTGAENNQNNSNNANNSNNSNNGLADMVSLSPEPSMITLAANGDGDYQGQFCMEDRLDPRQGLTLLAERCDDNNVIIGFTVLSADPTILYVGFSGIFNLTSNSLGEFGEGPYPGTMALRIPIESVSDIVLDSVVLGMETYTLEFQMTSAADANNYTVSIPSATATRNN